MKNPDKTLINPNKPDNQTKTMQQKLNGIPQVPIVPGLSLTGATPMSANEVIFKMLKV